MTILHLLGYYKPTIDKLRKVLSDNPIINVWSDEGPRSKLYYGDLYLNELDYLTLKIIFNDIVKENV